MPSTIFVSYSQEDHVHLNKVIKALSQRNVVAKENETVTDSLHKACAAKSDVSSIIRDIRQ